MIFFMGNQPGEGLVQEPPCLVIRTRAKFRTFPPQPSEDL